MYKKRALITGITGQDGSYLADFLLKKGYEVHGLRRRSSVDNTERLHQTKNSPNFKLHFGDLTDSSSLIRLMQMIQPDEVYNLAAQSDVAVSFENPEYTAEVNGIGTLRLLEAIRILGLTEKTRFYQASTSELFGSVQQIPQTEKTPFYPRSPYAVSKLYAYWITVNYREAYEMFACNGILFNHESPQRGEGFVTRKITRALGRIVCGLQDCLYLGNLNAERDWGHTRDFIEMQWSILQQTAPDDYVISTGEKHTVREFVTEAAAHLGIHLHWEGVGLEERGVVSSSGQVIVKVDPQFFRPAEVELLLGDPSKAFRNLGWQPKIAFKEIVAEMTAHDLELAKRECYDYNRCQAR